MQFWLQEGSRRFAAVRCVRLGVLLLLAVAAGADWPQWRHDAGRGASTPAALPAQLRLQWIRHLPEPQPAWPKSQPSLRFDVSYSPVAAGKQLFVPSMVTDSVTAYDAETGAQQWRFFADGPVRFAPVVYHDRVFFASDDGYLYCVTAEDGRLVWRFSGGPKQRNILGNQRLISTWPIRGGPVLLDDTIYFTAGIWPFMGVFIHAVDARTGKPVWTNSSDSCPYVIQPHRSPAFSGFVPRGHLAASEGGLVIPGGRTPPACYDRETGQQLQWIWSHKGGGTCNVAAHMESYFTTDGLRKIADGSVVLPADWAVHDDTGFYSLSDNELVVHGFQLHERPLEKADSKGRSDGVSKRGLEKAWKVSVGDDCGRLMLKAGGRFYAGNSGSISALDVDAAEGKATIAWRQSIEGEPWTMLAADDRLFVVTAAGDIYCFGGKSVAPTAYDRPALGNAVQQDGNARNILQAAGVSEGYALVFGLGTGRLAEGLARASKLHVIAIDPDSEKIDAFRRRMTDAGLYGTRVEARTGDPTDYPLPPYLASLIVCDDLKAAGIDRSEAFFQSVYHALRPYGGTAHLPLAAKSVREKLAAIDLPGAEIKADGDDAALLVRTGPLPGAADWTHQYADAANTVVSQDCQVKAPLGLLWFGGPPNDEVLPRHGHGPSPQVAAGRLFIEGPDMLRAIDIYTGRLLWQTALPKLGKFYDNTSHQPGAGEIGSNYVSLPDSVYVAYADSILRLDAATGRLLDRFTLQTESDRPAPRWGYLGVSEDLLVATSTPIAVPEKKSSVMDFMSRSESARSEQSPSLQKLLTPVPYASTSQRLAVLDRRTGRVLWDRTAKYGFRHNNIALGNGKLFCIDGLSTMQQQLLARRGIDLAQFSEKLMALDLRTGKELWSTSEDVSGTFLGYSAEHDILLQAGSAARDRAADETRVGMVAYRGVDGHVLWQDLDRSYSGPCMLHGDTIITQSTSFSLLTGQPQMRRHPLTGEPIPWQYKRNYGCNTVIASRNLLTFRSAAAGFFDLARDGGTGNLGGFKSSCTSNLIAAGGLLNAPEYTRTCICNYQNQTSLAMMYDPEVEMWTFNDLEWDGAPVKRVGINFGAPGDRRADNGTLWLDWPSVGGPSPDLPLEIAPESVETFRYHSSLIRSAPESGDLPWVAASGIEDARRIVLTLAKAPAAPRRYTVRLHFMEPDESSQTHRVVRVRLQGAVVLSGLDVAAEVGHMTASVKEFPGIEVSDRLVVELDAAGDDPKAKPILCGLEVVQDSATTQPHEQP